jgi:hypothetical protein
LSSNEKVAIVFTKLTTLFLKRLTAPLILSGSALVVVSFLLATYSPIRAATIRYVNADNTCGGLTPCHINLAVALDNAAAGDEIRVQNAVAGVNNYDLSGKANILITNDPNYAPYPVVGGGVVFTSVNNLTIQNIAVGDAVIIRQITGALTINNTRPLAIYIQPHNADLNATINITNNVFTNPVSEISIIGLNALGKDFVGTYTISGNSGMQYINVLTYVTNTGDADMGATVNISNNTIVKGANVGVTSTGTQGTGNIYGNVTYNQNTTQSTTEGGLNVTIGTNATGQITGSCTFTNNNSVKIACITFDAINNNNNHMTGNAIATGNTGQFIEFGYKGDFTGSQITVENNILNFAGFNEETVITVRANQFSNLTTTNVRNNTGRFGITFDTFTGANGSPVLIENNQTTFFIGYRTQTANTGEVTIRNNTVQAGARINLADDGKITVTGRGTVGNLNLVNNTAPQLSSEAATQYVGTINMTGNTFANTVAFVASGSTGTGLLKAYGNRINTNVNDGFGITRLNSDVHYNAIMGILSINNATLSAENNWWGCNGGTGNPACQPFPTPNSTPYLQFNVQLLCGSANNKVFAGFHVNRNSSGTLLLPTQPTGPGVISVPGNVGLVTTVGTIPASVPLLPTYSWNSAVVDVPANGNPTVTFTLDRQTLQATRQCQTRRDTVGIVRAGQFLLRTDNSTGSPDITVNFGDSAWKPITGDWDGDQVDTVGAYNSVTGVFYIRNSNTTGGADSAFVLGNPNDTPIAGRWDPAMNNDGAGVFRPSNGIIYLKRALTSGFSDYYMVLGNPGDIGFAGDWDGNGFDGPGVFRPSQGRFFLSNNGTAYGIIFSDADAFFGTGTDTNPVIGDWAGDSSSGIGIFRNGLFLLRNSVTTGGADLTFSYGTTGDWAVAGHWTAAPYDSTLGNVIVQPGYATDGGSGNAD